MDSTGEIMGSVCFNFGCEVVEFNRESNYVHLLGELPAQGFGSKGGKELQRYLSVASASRLL
ncbi:MAG: hypothetical protein ACYDHP_03995 [Ferrimicrobium sp.]